MCNISDNQSNQTIMGDEGEWKTLLKSVKNKKITHKGRHLEVSINLFAFFEYLCFFAFILFQR